MTMRGPKERRSCQLPLLCTSPWSATWSAAWCAAKTITTVVTVASMVIAIPAEAQEFCPSAEHIPQLTIDKVVNPGVPVIDDWQPMFRGVALSDAQLAELARVDPLIDITRDEMNDRGTWVYIGLLTATVGAILSSVGWYLYGSNDGKSADNQSVPVAVSLTMALGGLGLAGGGTLVVAEAIQRPLEPHLAPTPEHRLSREQVRHLVALINQQLYSEVCAAADHKPKTESDAAPADNAGTPKAEAFGSVDAATPEDTKTTVPTDGVITPD